MWFDLVLIDRLYDDGHLVSSHIRADLDRRFAVDRLEDINPDFRSANIQDLGPLRIYGADGVKSAVLESQLQNFVSEPHQIMVQLDHFGIPVHSGYYAIIFPKGWRVAELNIYDPYHLAENIADKKSFREINITWDADLQMSCAQFNMESVRRGSFSIGVIASLCRADANVPWKDRPGRLFVEFTDQRHDTQPSAPGYRAVTNAVVGKAVSESKMPGINLGLSGPSINIVEWGRYLMGKVRKP